jgi:hypothetical protein
VLAAAVAVALAAGLVACGGDDSSTDRRPAEDTVAPADDTDAPADTIADDDPLPGGDADLAEQCALYTKVSHAIGGGGDPTEAVVDLTQLAFNAPAQIAAETVTFVDGFTAAVNGDPAALETAEFTSALGYVGSYFFDHCELADQLEVTGGDYTYGGLRQEITAGTVGIRFVNISAANEPHELALLRRPDGDTRSIEEIAELDPDTLFTEYEPVGVAWANVPAASMSVLLDVTPGDYVVICNLPTKGDESTPHSHNGMVAELVAA